MERLIVLTLLAGCSAPRSSRPTLDLAPAPTAELSLSMVTDGQDTTLVEGAQGGFHVWLSYAVRGMAPATVTLERTAHRVSDGAVVLVYRGDVDIGAPDDSGWWTAPSPIPMFMCPSPIGLSIVDVPIELTLRLLGDADAELARASVTVVPRCPDAQLEFCMRICTG